MMVSNDPFDWRGRDNEILKRVRQHPCCPRHFFDLFGSQQAVYRRLARLVELKQLRLIGEIMVGDSGRPQKVYCNGWKPKPDQIRHEVLLTDFLFCYPSSYITRGWLVNKDLRPDAEMTLGGIRFNVELDTGTESHSQVRRRQQVYVGSTEFVLFVTLSARRLRGLTSKCLTAVKDICLFTTLDQVKTDPAGSIWIDSNGGQTSIVKS